jgi:transposase
MSAQLALALPCAAPSNCVIINARCSLRAEEDQRVIVVAGLPVHHYRAEDAVAEAYAMVFLVESGFAQQTEVARAFARSERTVRRYQERYAQGGMAALGRAAGWSRGRRRIRGKRLRSIEALKSQGLSNRAIAQRLGVNEKAIRKLVGPSKLVEAEQFELATIRSAAASEPPQRPLPPATSTPEDAPGSIPALHHGQTGDADDTQDEPVAMSLDRDASDRSLDRQLAHLGLLDDAAPIFRDGAQVPGVGVLLAIPALVESELLRISRRLYGSSHRGARCVARLQAKYPRLVPVHGPIHASWLNQIEIYFSIIQRKVLTPNDFPSLAAVKQRLLAFQTHYEAVAQPFEWKFTRHDLARLLNKFRSHSNPLLRIAA